MSASNVPSGPGSKSKNVPSGSGSGSNKSTPPAASASRGSRGSLGASVRASKGAKGSNSAASLKASRSLKRPADAMSQVLSQVQEGGNSGLIVVGAVLFLGGALLFCAWWFELICKKEVGTNSAEGDIAAKKAKQDVQDIQKETEDHKAVALQRQEEVATAAPEDKAALQIEADKAERVVEQDAAKLEKAESKLAELLASLGAAGESRGRDDGEKTTPENVDKGEQLRKGSGVWFRAIPHRFTLEAALQSPDKKEAVRQADAEMLKKTAPYEALVAELLIKTTSDKFKKTTPTVKIPSDFIKLQDKSDLDLMRSFEDEPTKDPMITLNTSDESIKDHLKFLMKLQTLKIMYQARQQAIGKLHTGGVVLRSKIQHVNVAESRLQDYVKKLEEVGGFAAVYFPKNFSYLTNHPKSYGIHPGFVGTDLTDFKSDDMTPLFEALEVMTTVDGAWVDIQNTKTLFKITKDWKEHMAAKENRLAGVAASAMIDQVIVEVHKAVEKSQEKNVKAFDDATKEAHDQILADKKPEEAQKA